MRSRGSCRVLLRLNSSFSMAPTYFTRNSAHASDELLPTETQGISRRGEEAPRVDHEGRSRTHQNSWWSRCRDWRRCWTWTDPPGWSPQTANSQQHGLAASRAGGAVQRSWRFTLLLVLISLLWELLLLLWRFFTFRNMVHHDEPQAASLPRPRPPAGGHNSHPSRPNTRRLHGTDICMPSFL